MNVVSVDVNVACLGRTSYDGSSISVVLFIDYFMDRAFRASVYCAEARFGLYRYNRILQNACTRDWANLAVSIVSVLYSGHSTLLMQSNSTGGVLLGLRPGSLNMLLNNSVFIEVSAYEVIIRQCLRDYEFS